MENLHFTGQMMGVKFGNGSTPIRVALLRNLFGLPDSLGRSIHVEQGKPNTLYVCSEVGVFQTNNGGMWWRPFDKGLPNAVLSDMEYQPHTQTLFVLTIGRGMFKTLLH